MWQSLFNSYNQVLPNFGCNDFEVEHNGAEARQKVWRLSKYIEINRAAYNAVLDWWCNGGRIDVIH